jgi:hypothetical protein
MGIAKHAVKKVMMNLGVEPIRATRTILFTRPDLVKWLGEERVQELFGDYFDGGDSK